MLNRRVILDLTEREAQARSRLEDALRENRRLEETLAAVRAALEASDGEVAAAHGATADAEARAFGWFPASLGAP